MTAGSPSEEGGLHAGWYLVFTKVNQERTACEHLGRQGYRVFLPRLAARRRRSGRRLPAQALFPRYLFIFLEPGHDDWGPIRSTTGVQKLVRFGDHPARVPAVLVEALLARADAGGLLPLPEPQFAAGQRVRVTEGPVAGTEAIFAAEKSADRVVILLDLVGRESRLELDRDMLEAAD
ncbi:MAG: transcription/translation regulatory transformer protein RfaH [Gammaproteobacteria bacterium]|nr:transcription/translation regulatory transformer protein RfaH [Gammaproteobacteria bacterium]